MSSRMLRGGAPVAVRKVVAMFTTHSPTTRLSRLLMCPKTLAQLEKHTGRVPCSIHSRVTTCREAIRAIVDLFTNTKWASRGFVRDAAGCNTGVISILDDTRELFVRINTFEPSGRLVQITRFIEGKYARFVHIAVALALYVFGVIRFAAQDRSRCEYRTQLLDACREWMMILFPLIEDTLGSTIRLPVPGMGNPEWTPSRTPPTDFRAIDPAMGGIIHDAVSSVHPSASKRLSIAPIHRLLHLVFSTTTKHDIASTVMSIVDADESIHRSLASVEAAIAVRCVAIQAHPHVRVSLLLASACAITTPITDAQWATWLVDPVRAVRALVDWCAEGVIEDVRRVLEQFTESNVALAKFKRLSMLPLVGYHTGIDTFWEAILAATAPQKCTTSTVIKKYRVLFDWAHLLSGPTSEEGEGDADTPVGATVPPASAVRGVAPIIAHTVRSAWRIITIALLSAGVVDQDTWRSDWACVLELLVSHFRGSGVRPRAVGRNPRIGPVMYAVATAFHQWRTTFSVQLPSLVYESQARSLRRRYAAIGCEVLPFADTVYVCMQCAKMYRASVPMPREVVAPSNRDAVIHAALRRYRIHNTRYTDGCASGAYTCAGLTPTARPLLMCGKCVPRSRASTRTEVMEETRLASCGALGRLVCVDGRFYTICSNEDCGVVCEFAPRRSVLSLTEEGRVTIACHSCVSRCAIHDRQYTTERIIL